MPSSAARRERRQQKFGGAPAPSSAGRASAAQTLTASVDTSTQQRDIVAAAQPVKVAPTRAGTEWDAEMSEPEEDDVRCEADAPKQTTSESRGQAHRIACTVFVGQLPYSADASMVRKFFKKSGVVGGVRVRLLTRRDGGGSRGMAFVELDSEADVHTALRQHKAPMDGRRINVERTVGGGGPTAKRQEKLADLRERQGRQMHSNLKAMVASILPADGDAVLQPEDEGDGEGELVAGISQADVDERVLEFLATVPQAVAEASLREVKALDMRGIRNRAAYLMGVLKRKVAEEDTLRMDRQSERQRKTAISNEMKPAAVANGKRKVFTDDDEQDDRLSKKQRKSTEEDSPVQASSKRGEQTELARKAAKKEKSEKKKDKKDKDTKEKKEKKEKKQRTGN